MTTGSLILWDGKGQKILHQSPRDSFAQGMLQSGDRTHRMIPYNKDFCLLTRPTTQRGTAKVQPGHGVKVNYIYYWSNLFLDPELENTQVSVRYNIPGIRRNDEGVVLIKQSTSAAK